MLTVGGTKMALSEADICAQLHQEYPELRDELEDECFQGVHLQLSCLMRATQAAISDGDRDFLQRAFAFADKSLRLGHASVKNAIAVSFLEHLTFSDTKKSRRSWALGMMTPLLQQEYRDVVAYWDALHERQP